MKDQKIINDFLEYWDNILNQWIQTGTIPDSESHWKNEELVSPKFSKLILQRIMPGPYLGNPYNCSTVILSYNPGSKPYNLETKEGKEKYFEDEEHHSQISNPTKMAYKYAHNPRWRTADDAFQNLHPDGKKWWKKHLDWIKEIVPESSNNPFSIELCPWHSYKWQNLKYNKKLLNTLSTRLSSVIEETIRKSDLGIGFCIGAQWGDKVLPAFGYKDVTAEVMGLDNYKRGWKPSPEKYRNFRIMRNGNGFYIINTWLSKGFKLMREPVKESLPIQLEMIKKIRSHSKEFTSK